MEEVELLENALVALCAIRDDFLRHKPRVYGPQHRIDMRSNMPLLRVPH